jgi:hypothetical protein
MDASWQLMHGMENVAAFFFREMVIVVCRMWGGEWTNYVVVGNVMRQNCENMMYLQTKKGGQGRSIN